MPNQDRRGRNNGGACLAAEQERRASNLLWAGNVRISAAELAGWALGPNLIESRKPRGSRRASVR